MKEWLIQLALLSLSGTVLMLVLLAVRRLTGERLPKAFFYYAWLLVLLRLLVPFGYGLSVPIPAAPSGAETVQTDTVPGLDTMQPAAEDTPAEPNAADPEAAEPPAALPQTAAGHTLPALPQILFGVWLAGAAGSLGWYVFAYVVFVRSIRKSLYMPRFAEAALLRSLQPKGRVRLRWSGAIETPMLVGVLRPVILLPTRRMQQLEQPAMAAILRHELTHYRRKDIPYKWLVILVTSMHWFNPFVYRMRREIALDCELSCDEAVIRTMTGAEKTAYGEALLSLAARSRPFPGVTATTLCEEKRQLKARLQGIRHGRKPTKAALGGMLVCGLVLCCCACAAFRLPETDASSAGSAAPDSTSQAASAGTASAGTYQTVLLEKGRFRYDDGSGASAEYTIEEVPALFSPYSDYAAITEFAVLDLDGDGADEWILHVTDVAGDMGGYLILREQNGTVQGFSGDWRMFAALKTDGTFSYSTAAGTEEGAARLHFSENGYTMETLFCWQGAQFQAETFQVDGQPATQAAYEAALAQQSDKPDAVWHAFSEENIRQYAAGAAPASS